MATNSIARLVRHAVTVGLFTVGTLALAASGPGGGGGGGNTGGRLTAPGQCTLAGRPDPTTTAEALLVKQQNQWVFGLTVVGPNSIGNWSIKYSKNNQFNVFVDPVPFPPPGGWTTFVAATAPGDKGMVTFTAEASSQTGEVCTGMLGIRL